MNTIVKHTRIFKADTSNPDTGETVRRTWIETSTGEELKVLDGDDAIRAAHSNKQLRFVRIEGEFGAYARLSNKANIEDFVLDEVEEAVEA